MKHGFLAIALFTALLFPQVGPVIDHHFAERAPLHNHLAPGKQAHKHRYSTSHSHQLAASSPALETVVTSLEEDAYGGSMALLALVPPGLERPLLAPLPYAIPNQQTLLLSAYLPPPEPPPRVAFL